MKNIKDELQNIILGNGEVGAKSRLKKVQIFLRRHAEASSSTQKQQYFKSKEAAELVNFARKKKLFYEKEINEDDFIGSGAEQRVYRLSETHVIKTNGGIFYEYWIDYFNSLLIHNYFFPSTTYTFLGFRIIDNDLHAVVRQKFIGATESTDLATVKDYLTHNQFFNTRNNDYANTDLGLIFEDLHDENVLSKNSMLRFIDTIFYLTPQFYLKA
jgi:hypothetical protein